MTSAAPNKGRHSRYKPQMATSLATWVALALFTTTAQAAPEIPGPPQEHPIALVGAVIHPVDGPDIEGGTLLLDRGKIVAVGNNVELPAGTEVIELKGQHIYPGLCDAYTNLGLVEIGAVRATIDEAESGSLNPNVRAQVAFNADSELIPVTRSNGVLSVLTAPSGGLISGRSALMQLDGWTWEDMTIRADVGMHVRWPTISTSASSDDGEETRNTQLQQLRDLFDNARAYQQAQQGRRQQNQPPLDHDLRYEALLPVLARKVPLMVQADRLPQIQSAVAFARQQQVELVIVGGYDTPLCTDLLKEHDVAVIIDGVNRLPARRDDPIDAAFRVPARLHAAGVRFCIADGERMSNQRNLPYQAAAAAAYGLPREEALKAITIYPAQILGADYRIGSLAEGKDATLIVTTGDPLEIPTQVVMAMVEGRMVDLSNRHKRLWEKYQEKYRRLHLPAAQ